MKKDGGFRDYPLAWHCDDDIVIRQGNNGVVSSSQILFSFRMSGQNISTRVDNISDLKGKILATVQFFDFFSNYLSTLEFDSKFQIFMKDKLQERIEIGWLKEAIFNHLKAISYKKFILIILWLRQLNIISIKDAWVFVKEKAKLYVSR